MPTRSDTSAAALAALLLVAGITHFVKPEPYVAIVPRRLPRPDLLVAVSGAAELACAALIAHPRTRRFGGPATAALFIGVFPANVTMALKSTRRPAWYRTLLWLRLPLQWPLITWSLGVGRGA